MFYVREKSLYIVVWQQAVHTFSCSISEAGVQRVYYLLELSTSSRVPRDPAKDHVLLLDFKHAV